MNAERILLVLALLAGLALAPLRAQTLSAVYRKAQTEDAQYRAARKGFEAALEKLPQSRAALLPSVNLTGSNSNQVGDASFGYGPYENRSVNSWSWNAQITQALIRPGNWIAYRQAGAQIEHARAQLSVAEQDLMLRSAQSYLDVMLAKETIRVSEAQLGAVSEQLILAERNYSVGTGTITDVHEAKAKRGLALSQRIAAVNELASRQAELDKMLGETMALVPVRFKQDLPSITTVLLSDWLSSAATQNPQVKIQQAALEVAQKEVAKSMSAHAPTLDLTYSHNGVFNSGSLSSPADLATRTRSHQTALQLTVPLYSGGSVQSRVREALMLEDKARDELLLAQRSAASQVVQAYAGVRNGQAQIEALQAAVEAGGQAVEANKIGFKIGTRINPDVLNAEQQLYASMRDLMKARLDAVMQGLKLKAASGVLQELDLLELETLLEAN